MENIYFIREITHKTYREMFKSLNERAIQEKIGWRRFNSRYHKAILLCIEKRGGWKPIGYLMWSGRRKSIVLRQIWVRKEYRGQGAASFLFKEWYNWITSKRKRDLIIESPEQSVQNLLDKIGFTDYYL